MSRRWRTLENSAMLKYWFSRVQGRGEELDWRAHTCRVHYSKKKKEKNERPGSFSTCLHRHNHMFCTSLINIKASHEWDVLFLEFGLCGPAGMEWVVAVPVLHLLGLGSAASNSQLELYWPLTEWTEINKIEKENRWMNKWKRLFLRGNEAFHWKEFLLVAPPPPPWVGTLNRLRSPSLMDPLMSICSNEHGSQGNRLSSPFRMPVTFINCCWTSHFVLGSRNPWIKKKQKKQHRWEIRAFGFDC